jgi:hypothetical protein
MISTCGRGQIYTIGLVNITCMMPEKPITISLPRYTERPDHDDSSHPVIRFASVSSTSCNTVSCLPRRGGSSASMNGSIQPLMAYASLHTHTHGRSRVKRKRTSISLKCGGGSEPDEELWHGRPHQGKCTGAFASQSAFGHKPNLATEFAAHKHSAAHTIKLVTRDEIFVLMPVDTHARTYARTHHCN